MNPTLSYKKSRSTSSLFVKWSGLFMLLFLINEGMFGQYSGTGTFTKINSLAELTDGYYVVTNESDAFLMTNGRSGNATGGYFVSAVITPVSGVITDPSKDNVWKVEVSESGRTIYNEEISKYVGWSSGNAASIEDTPADTNRWTFTYISSKFTVLNVATTSRQLSYNSGATRFAAYANAGQEELQFYKYTPSGVTSTISGPWNEGATWGGSVPSSSENAIIANGHTVTVTNSLTRDLGTTTTVNSGGTLAVAATFTSNGTTTINGTFQLNDNGFADGSGIFKYSQSTGTLNFNKSTGSYGVANSHNYWPTTDGPYNVNVLQGGMNLESGADRTVNGTFSTKNVGSSNVSMASETDLILNGNCRIDAGGAFGSSPIYGNASTLIYNSGGTYGRGLEWNSISGAGFPNNVILKNSTSLNYINGFVGNKAISGNLTIEVGSSFYMNDNTSTSTSGGFFFISGNLVNNGILKLGNNDNDDLKIDGNFSNTGTFDGNGRAIFFVKNGTQTVSSTTALTIPYVVFAPISGSTILKLLNDVTISAPNSGNAISFNNANDVFDINGNTLIIGTSSVPNIISGLGTFKGSTTSNLTLLGAGSIGTLNFTTNWQNLKNLTLNRTPNQIGFKLGSPVTINNALNLTNGIIDLDSKTMTLGSAIANVGGVSSNNYIIADKTLGGVLRKKFADASEASASFTFPIGDKISSENGSQYSPATVSFETTDFSNGSISLNVVDNKEPDSQATTNYISRYWVFTGTGITNATYGFSGTYLPIDINGTESTSKSGRKRVSNSSWIEGVNLVAGANTVVMSDMTSSIAGITNNTYHFTAGSPLANAEINVTGNSIAILNGNSIIDTGNNTFIGTANVSAPETASVYKSFVISNTGKGSLVISDISFSGLNASDFTVSPTTMNIPAGSSQTFFVTFAPSNSGIKNAVISIVNNDMIGDDNPYTFAVQGNSVNYVECAPNEELVYQTGFESGEFTPNTSGGLVYNNEIIYFSGPNSMKWGTYFGTPSGTDEIIGNQSMQMRWYSSSEIKLGYTFTNFNITNLKKVIFNAASTGGISVIVSYSIDNGANWAEDHTFTLSNTNDEYTYTLPTSVTSGRVRFLLKLPISEPVHKSRLYIDNVRIYAEKNNTKTWNGTAWSGDGLPPTTSQKVIIDGDLTLLNAILEGCECQVNAGKTLIAGDELGTTPATINIQSNIVANGTVDIKNNSSLVQHNDLATYMGVNLSMKRTTQNMYRYDYTYWSSPVGSGFTLNDLSPNTLANKYFKWNSSTATWQVIQNGNVAMEAGKGYIVRAPQTFAVEGAGIATAYTANFIGKPNNGEVTIPVTRSSTVNKWNLIGNPYPSAINADAFLSLNAPIVNPTLGGTLYFWTHNTGIGTVGSTYSYNPSDYASWNGTGSAATSPGNNNAPLGKIAAGQGFFVRGIGNGPGLATFNNSMRVPGENDQFFKSPTIVEKHRVWLNMKGTTKGFSQTLVGYVTNATNGLDNRFDGETFGGNQVTFYSMLDTKALVIQGRALPFADSDTVPLGYKSTITESISIGIDHFDGLFDNQNIYLEDTNLNIIHNLKTSDYTFAAVPGTFNSRFILRYLPEEVLSNPTFDQQLQSVIIRKKDDIIRVNSPYEIIQTVWVYDLMGRLIFEQTNCNTNVFETNKVTQINQTLIVKVRLNNGGVVTGKL